MHIFGLVTEWYSLWLSFRRERCSRMLVVDGYGMEPGAKRHFLSAPFFVLFYVLFNHFHSLLCYKVATFTFYVFLLS